MVLNFYLELAAFIIGIILCMNCINQYKITDLKGKVYVNMLRVVTAMSGCNLVSYIVVRNNISMLMAVAEVIICFSFILMVGIWMYLDLYLIESIKEKNYFHYTTYLYTGLPLFLQLVVILINWGTHSLFDVSMLDESIQITFNTWYKYPYILAAIALVIYILIFLRNYRVFREKKQMVFFVVPLLMIVFYYLQYRFKAVAILGFGYILVLLLLYLYSFSRSIIPDSLTGLPDGSSFKRMLDYRIGQKQVMTVVMIRLDDFKQIRREYGYQNSNRYLKLIAMYIKEKAPKYCMSRYSENQFAIIFDEQSERDVQVWCDEILTRFESVWEIDELQHKLSACISVAEYPKMADTSEQILELLEHIDLDDAI